MPIAITPPVTPATPDLMASLSQKKTANKKRKIICFSDFDGTIFMQDTGHVLFDKYGCGSQQRALLEEQINSGERSFRDVSEEMWGSLHVPFEDGFDVLRRELDIDPDFQAFHRFCLDNDIPFNVISAGLKPVLKKVLDTFLGEEESSHIGIVANDAKVKPDGSEWKPIWRHDTELGHDKALSIQEARQEASSSSSASLHQHQHHEQPRRIDEKHSDEGDKAAEAEEAEQEAEEAEEEEAVPLIVFIGDGVSDLPAAREADVLFARRGLRLEAYCGEHGIACVPFDTFADVERCLRRIADEDRRATGGRGKPARFNPRADLWRRVSNKTGSGSSGGRSHEAARRCVAMTPSREERMFLWPEAFSELTAVAAPAVKATTPAVNVVAQA